MEWLFCPLMWAMKPTPQASCSLAGSDEIKELPLSKAWPTPDYQKLLDSGIQPWFVAYARAARDSIPAKPQTGWKQQRWAEAVKTMRDTALGLLEGDSSSEQLRQQIAK